MPDLVEVAKAVNKMFTDLYVGDGKENPSITTRLDRVEQITSGLTQLKWIIVTGIVAAVWDIIQTHLK